MPLLFTYLLKLSLSLGVVFFFYHLVLRKLTFYNWNRWYLLGYTILCFFIPFIDISTVLEKQDWTTSTIVRWVPVVGPVAKANTDAQPGYFTLWNIVILLLIIGMLIMLIRLLLQLISFRRMMKKAKFVSGEGMNIYQVDEEIIPFSFGNSIFINHRLHTPDELQEIIRHEFVHVKQKHSMDIIWAELLCLINWYNPFAWLIRRSIRQNLEFIADNKVLRNGINKKQYQYLLLKVIGNNHYSIAPKFNFSSLKKRIAMMNKNKTARLHLVRFLFILPLLAVILLSFRKQIGDSFKQHRTGEIIISGDFTDTVPEVTELNDKGYFIDIKGKDGNCIVLVRNKDRKEVTRVLLTKWQENEKYYEDLYGKIPPPPPPAPPAPPVPPQPMELPGNVKKLEIIDGKKATVELKNGKIEKYDLGKADEKSAFEKKYGEIVSPPEPPAKAELPMAPPPPPAPPAKNSNLSVLSNDFEITDKKAVIHLKNGTTETYDLTNAEQKKKFEDKYGTIIELTNVSTTISGVDPVISLNTPVKAISNINVEPITVTGVKLSTAGTTAPVKTISNINVEPITVTGVKLSNVGTTAPVNAASHVNLEPVTVTGRPIVKLSSPVVAVNGEPGMIAPVTSNLSTPVTVAGYPSATITGDEDVVVTISKYSTKQQLEEFKKQMKEKGVELRFDKTEYNAKGVLTHISGSMKTKDSNNNFSATDFERLLLAMTMKGSKTFLKVNIVDKEVI